LITQLADLLLLLLGTLRLTRLVTTDDVGLWLVRSPAYRWARYAPVDWDTFAPVGHSSRTDTWRRKLASGLECPHCVGFWIGCSLLLILALTGGPGHDQGASAAHTLWEFVTGAFALSYLVGHISARLD
jgi:uncharacterized protein DUF1360